MSSAHHPLTKRQKAVLVQSARVAWELGGARDRAVAESEAADPFGVGDKESTLFESWRRDQQLAVAGQASLTRCQQRHYRPLIDHYIRLKNGDVGTSGSQEVETSRVPAAGEEWPLGEAPANLWSEERGPQLRKIGKLLVTAGRPWEYAHTIAARMCKVDRLDWCNASHLRRIIGVLVKDHRRHGRAIDAK